MSAALWCLPFNFSLNRVELEKKLWLTSTRTSRTCPHWLIVEREIGVNFDAWNFNQKIGSRFNSINVRKFVLSCRFFILSNFHFQGRPTRRVEPCLANHLIWKWAKDVADCVSLAWDERKREKCDVVRKSRERNFGIFFLFSMRFYVPWNDFMVYKSVDHFNCEIVCSIVDQITQKLIGHDFSLSNISILKTKEFLLDGWIRSTLNFTLTCFFSSNSFTF